MAICILHFFFIRTLFIRTASLKLGQKIRTFIMLIMNGKLKCSYLLEQAGLSVKIILKIAYFQEKSA